MTQYRIYIVDGNSDVGAVFQDEERASEMCAHLNRKYESEYRIEEVEDDEFVTAAELMHAKIIESAERA